MSLVLVKSNDELETERKANLSETKIEIFKYSLANLIRKDWERAARAKQKIDTILLKSLRYRNMEYEPSHLSAMRQLYGADYSPIFMPIVLTKGISAENWIKDIVLSSDDKPWGLSPTPKPDLTDEEEAKVVDKVIAQEMQKMNMNAQVQGVAPNLKDVGAGFDDNMPKAIEEAIAKKSKEITEDVKLRLDDQLVEGDWYEQLERSLPDIVWKTGFVKGPIFVKEKFYKQQYNAIMDMDEVIIEEKVITKYEHRSPFDIYPASDSSGINDGYLIDKISLNPVDLANLKGVPGYDDEAINRVLDAYRSGGLHEWTNVDSERAEQENKESPLFDSDKLDCLEYWNFVKGDVLIQWGITKDEKETPIDATEYYDIVAWLIGNEVIGAKLNPDPLGRKPFSKASWVEVEGSFWGIGLPEILSDVQDACNAVARAIIHNVAFASGPQVELNIDRMDMTESGQLYPLKVWKVTANQMMEAQAVRFTDPKMVADRLIQVYMFFSKIADEISVPAYAHGDTRVGGGGRTASGLSMLFGAAAKNIKGVIKNIDNGIIEPTVERQYFYNLVYGLLGKIPDMKIVAKGSEAMILREQKAAKLMEFMNLTNNPVDLEHIDRKKVVKKVAKAQGIDYEDIKKDEIMQQNPMMEMMQNTGNLKNNPQLFNALSGGSMPKTDVAGNLPAGMETREFGTGENT